MTLESNNIFDPFVFESSETPVFVSMPHSGLRITAELEACLTVKARTLPDTDWYVPQLYSNLGELGVGRIQANYSRYVIDMNRPLDDMPLYQSKTTGLFPDILFDETAVFESGRQPGERHQAACKREIWQTYHNKIEQELARLKAKFGYAILFDAHSIAARVPMLFDGQLPDFNFGNNDGVSCADNLAEAAAEVVASSEYSQVTNGRFKGGYITRSFGCPAQGIHAIQLELSQATYLDDLTEGFQFDHDKLVRLQRTLGELIETLVRVTPRY